MNTFVQNFKHHNKNIIIFIIIEILEYYLIVDSINLSILRVNFLAHIHSH